MAEAELDHSHDTTQTQLHISKPASSAVSDSGAALGAVDAIARDGRSSLVSQNSWRIDAEVDGGTSAARSDGGGGASRGGSNRAGGERAGGDGIRRTGAPPSVRSVDAGGAGGKQLHHSH